MELEIQKYLRSEKTLQDLIWDYDLQTFESENYPELISFDYSILSPKNEKIVQEARGLVLKKDTWEVCCISMPSFQYENENLEYKNSKAFTKYDGCLVILYFYNGSWNIATRFSIDGDCSVASAYSKEKNITWAELFTKTLLSMKFDQTKFYNALDENCCYSFELCTKYNKNVIVYNGDFFKLIAITDKTTFQEKEILSSELMFLYPELEPVFVEIQTKEEIEDILSKDIPGYELEGYVVRDSNFNRRKLRNPNFDALSIFDDSKNYEYIQRLIQEISPVDPGAP